MNWLFALLAAVMGTGSALLVFSDRPGILERWLLIVGALFFFYCAYMIARRANTRRPASFDSRGLWIDGPSRRKMIAWDNIECVTTTSVSSQRFNVLALKEPSRLIEQYDAAEAKAAVSQENFVAMLGTAMGLGAKKAPDLAAMFADRRRQWGGEVWLSMYDRDRDVEAFDSLLRAWWKKYRRDD